MHFFSFFFFLIKVFSYLVTNVKISNAFPFDFLIKMFQELLLTLVTKSSCWKQWFCVSYLAKMLKAKATMLIKWKYCPVDLKNHVTVNQWEKIFHRKSPKMQHELDKLNYILTLPSYCQRQNLKKLFQIWISGEYSENVIGLRHCFEIISYSTLVLHKLLVLLLNKT